MALNEQLKLLIGLQEIDSAILAIAEGIELLPNKLEKGRAILKEANTVFEKVKAKHDETISRKKKKESDLEEMQEKINKLKSKGSEIKTNKEYEAHLKEVKTFEDKKYLIEEEILSTMEALDSLSKDIKKEEAKFKKTEENFKHEEKLLEEDKNRLHSEMEVFKIKRKDLAKIVDEEIYEKYMNLIKSSGGLAVVQTQGEICLGCHTNIPPQLYNDIRSTQDIFTCYHCNRFLFYLAAGESAPGGKEK
jgi:predicted  nucleic acid-binding Zn-ribbon protein